MSKNLIVNFIAIIASSLLLQNYAYAHDYIEGNTIKDNKKKPMSDFLPTNTVGALSKQFSTELLRLDIPNQQPEQETDQHQLEQFFLANSSEQLQKNIALRFQTGSYSLKNNYVLSSNYKPYLTNQLSLTSAVEHDLYQLGRFSAETGYAQGNSIYQKSYKAFIRSAFSLVNKGRFDLSLTASFESFTAPKAQYGLPIALSRQINSPTTSATLGVIGSFDLSERWSLISALTVSQLDTDENTYFYTSTETINMALIGTTYSF